MRFFLKYARVYWHDSIAKQEDTATSDIVYIVLLRRLKMFNPAHPGEVYL